MTKLHPVIAEVTARIEARSKDSRAAYLDMIRSRKPDGFARAKLTEGNLAHASAGCAVMDKVELLGGSWPNVGIVTSYNDMLSAHAPFEHYPEIIRDEARKNTATAQVSGGVPAMCDGVTQGQDGMELSLFSRDVIAMASAVSMSHDTYDGMLHLGVCDKIIPGLVIAALRFGWLPHIMVPAGPMPSGLPNPEKQRVRQEFALGNVGREELLKVEAASYHTQGTCTFYGTANSNQMMMEVMGFHLPGAAFPNPKDTLREALTRGTVRQVLKNSIGGEYQPLGEMVSAATFVNAIVGLMATGGSTNHTLHLPAMAAAAGYEVTLEDFAEISAVTPLLCKIYPNGPADVNHFHAAGGMGFVVRELLKAGLMNGDAMGVAGPISTYSQEPYLDGDTLKWREAPEVSGDLDIIRPYDDPFAPTGGVQMLDGPLGRGVIKVSAVKPERYVTEAPCRVFEHQDAVKAAFKAGELDRDVVIVVRFQGPAANGMPELHGLSAPIGALQDKGFKVALVTDGRMSGASGKFPAAIHVGPEAAKGGALAKVRDGDVIRLDAAAGRLTVHVPDDEFVARELAVHRPNQSGMGLGRELFAGMRDIVSTSEKGGSVFSMLTGGDV